MPNTRLSWRNIFALAAVASVTMIHPVPCLAQADATWNSFVVQYRALREEGIGLWDSCQSADLTNDSALLALQRKVLEYQKRLGSFSRGVQEHSLDAQREEISHGRIPGDDGHAFFVIARAADALSNFLGFASDYLSFKQGLFLRVAQKYEEGWRALDDAIQQ